MLRSSTDAHLCLAAAVLSAASLAAHAADNPPPNQPPGEHSTICMGDGTSVRDDELANMVKTAIQNSGKTPSSVKTLFNSCYGGGMLDDMSNAMQSLGIPFVGGSASSPTECAWGPSNAAVGATNAGSYWTNSLTGNIVAGQNVSQSLNNTAASDPAKPGGACNLAKPEHPTSFSSGGGSNVNWGPAETVVFSGNNNRTRHNNNVANMESTFLSQFGQTFSSSANGNTKSSLQSMLNAAANSINNGEELILYIDDHGNTEFDFDEWWNFITHGPITLHPVDGWNSRYDPFEGGLGQTSMLHQGWTQGISANIAQGDIVQPGILLSLDTVAPCPFDSFFDVFLNGFAVELPASIDPGAQVFIPVNPNAIVDGDNLLTIAGNGLAPAPIGVLNLELSSGPINDLDWNFNNVPEPASLGLFALTLAATLIRRRRS